MMFYSLSVCVYAMVSQTHSLDAWRPTILQVLRGRERCCLLQKKRTVSVFRRAPMTPLHNRCNDRLCKYTCIYVNITLTESAATESDAPPLRRPNAITLLYVRKDVINSHVHSIPQKLITIY